LILRALGDHLLDPAKCQIGGDKPSDIEAGSGSGVRGALYDGGLLDSVLAKSFSIEH
jgi:hypothetical protein